MAFVVFLALLLLPCARADEPARPKPARSRQERSTGMPSGAAQRNENVQVNRIDNNAVKEATIRLGASPTTLEFPTPARSYFGSEHGKAPGEPLFVPKAATGLRRWNATLFEQHRNSVFNARTFFQVGPVKPSHTNSYGMTAGGPAGRRGYVSLEASQRKVRGMVNGNVLVPLASERTPRAGDPAVRALVARMLAAYKPELPNRPDFDLRALNTNSPQTIDDNRVLGAFERTLGEARLTARYLWTTTRINAFQFVAGQNPDTTLRSHRARLTFERPYAGGTLSLGAGFDRLHSLLVAEPRAFPMRVRFGFQIEELGPQAEFPIDRVDNAFRAGAQILLPRGNHRWMAGTDLARFQLNGRESLNSRGYLQFTNNFGRSAIENFLLGTPSTYEVTEGEFTRGFRNLEWNAWFGDTWRPGARWQLSYGLRYNLRTAPHEVNRRMPIAFGCDCNNFSPRFGIAYRPGGDSGRDYGVVRADYTVSYGEIFGVTYQQARLNPPEARYVQVANPNLLDLLAGATGSRTGLLLLSPDLVSPYSHQYSLVWQREFRKTWTLQLGYVGSRSFKLLFPWITNRARPVPGLPLTTANANERRPDPSHYEIVRIMSSAIAYFDAAQARITLPYYRGLSLAASYTFGKAIDTGASYIGTAAQSDVTKGRTQSEFDVVGDRRALSDFDSPHSLLLQYSYDLPVPFALHRAARVLLGGWQVSGASLLKVGTPLTLYIGSDSPGFGNVDGGPGDRPNVVDPRVLGRTIGNPDTAQELLPRSAFAYIQPGEPRGNLGRNTFRKGPINNWNLALGRSWKLPFANGAERNLMFRAEAYNLTNHPQFDEPARNLSAPSFGKITNTLNDGRIFQFTLRLTL